MSGYGAEAVGANERLRGGGGRGEHALPRAILGRALTGAILEYLEHLEQRGKSAARSRSASNASGLALLELLSGVGGRRRRAKWNEEKRAAVEVQAASRTRRTAEANSHISEFDLRPSGSARTERRRAN